MKKIIVIVLLLTMCSCSGNPKISADSSSKMSESNVPDSVTAIRKFVGYDVVRLNTAYLTSPELDHNVKWEIFRTYGSKALSYVASRVYFSEREKDTNNLLVLKVHVNDVWSFSWINRCYELYDNGDRDYAFSAFDGVTIADVSVNGIICLNKEKQKLFDVVIALCPFTMYINIGAFWSENEDGVLAKFSFEGSGYVPKPGIDILMVVQGGKDISFADGETFIDGFRKRNEKIKKILNDGSEFSADELSEICKTNSDPVSTTGGRYFLLDFYPVTDLNGKEICNLDQFHSYMLKIDEQYREKRFNLPEEVRQNIGYGGFSEVPWANETIQGLFLGNPIENKYFYREMSYVETDFK